MPLSTPGTVHCWGGGAGRAIAVQEIRAGVASTTVERAVIVCYNQETRDSYEHVLRP